MPQVRNDDYQRVLGWLEQPSDQRGVRFRENDGSWQRLTYSALAVRTLRAGAALAESGVRPGDIVPIVLPTGPDFVAQFFGLLTIGATPSVLPTPSALRANERYQRQLLDMVGQIRPAHVLAAARYRDVITESVSRIETSQGITVLEPEYTEDTDRLPRAVADPALLQFSSGSRGSPRGLRISMANLAANLEMIRNWMNVGQQGPGTLSWLPLYHDMGLVGGMLTAMTSQSETGLMRPEQFLRDTKGWLTEYGRHDYGHIVMPNFGFERVLARVRHEDLEGLDFSHIRSVVSGAERVNPEVMAEFAALLEPHGLSADTFMPAYGLAECTVSVTGVRQGQRPRLVRIGSLERRLGEKVDVRETATFSSEPVEEPWLWQVSCGTPMEGLRVDILDDDGEPQPEGVLGEIAIEGPSVAEGYVDPSPEESAKLSQRKLLTGDAGFLLDGELYLVGRLGDNVKINGQNVFVEDIELELIASTGMMRRDIAVIAGVLTGKPAVIAVIERPPGDRLEKIEEILRSFTGSDAHTEVIQVRRGTIPLTSSGKPQRRALWVARMSGELTDERTSDS